MDTFRHFTAPLPFIFLFSILGMPPATGQAITANMPELSNENHRLYGSVERHSAEEQLTLGNAYKTGSSFGYPIDLAKAFYWYQQSARQGNSAAQYHVGTAYLLGEGIKKDLNFAVEWLTRSASQAYSPAQTALGNIYESENYKAYDTALYWYKKAAENKNTLGYYFLGRMYYSGMGIQQNFIQSYAWNSLAIDAVPDARMIMESSEKMMRGNELRVAKKLAEKYKQKYRS